MNIAFSPCDYLGCGYYRTVLPGYALHKNGRGVAFVSNESGRVAMESDVLIMQRESSQNALNALRLAKARGTVVIHEIDDNFNAVPKINPNSAWYGTGKPLTRFMEQICRESDAMIVSTPQLKEYYSKLNDRIFVCYNAIDDEEFEKYDAPITGKLKREGQVRIGYAGSNTHRGDFAMMLPALLRVMKEDHEVRIVFIGADMRDMFPLAIRHRTEFAGATAGERTLDGRNAARKDLPTHKYYALIRKSDFDVALAPIESNVFNGCKSYLKLEEYAFLGIPSIASNFGPYRQYQAESRERVCHLAGDEREWYKSLRTLIADESLRASLAKANHAYVKREHLISKKVAQWEHVLQAVAGHKQASPMCDMVAV